MRDILLGLANCFLLNADWTSVIICALASDRCTFLDMLWCLLVTILLIFILALNFVVAIGATFETLSTGTARHSLTTSGDWGQHCLCTQLRLLLTQWLLLNLLCSTASLLLLRVNRKVLDL